MEVSLEQLQRGVARYAEMELASKASGVGKFGVYFLMPAIPGAISKAWDRYSKQDMLSELFDEDGHMQLDVAHDWAHDAMQHVGRLEIAGFILDERDVDRLYECIRRA